jgi:hypothetical protein
MTPPLPLSSLSPQAAAEEDNEAEQPIAMMFDRIVLHPLIPTSMATITSVSPTSPLMSGAGGRIKCRVMGNMEVRAAAIHNHGPWSA